MAESLHSGPSTGDLCSFVSPVQCEKSMYSLSYHWCSICGYHIVLKIGFVPSDPVCPLQSSMFPAQALGSTFKYVGFLYSTTNLFIHLEMRFS